MNRLHIAVKSYGHFFTFSLKYFAINEVFEYAKKGSENGENSWNQSPQKIYFFSFGQFLVLRIFPSWIQNAVRFKNMEYMMKSKQASHCCKNRLPPKTCFYSNTDTLDPHCCNSRSLGATCFYSNMEPTRNVNKLRTERARWRRNAVKTGLLLLWLSEKKLKD